MFFARLFTVALSLAACGFSIAIPVVALLPAVSTDVVAAKAADLGFITGGLSPQEILEALKNQTGSLLPQIEDIIDAGQVTSENIGPIVEKLTTAVKSTVEALQSGEFEKLSITVLPVVLSLVNDLAKIGGTILKATGDADLLKFPGVKTATQEFVNVLDRAIPGLSTFVTPILDIFFESIADDN